MTGRIRILDAHLANQIAAGEVVERPAAVVKELVENAIDAQARTIAIVLSQAGMDMIRVTDDGIGMNQTDIALAFSRHATSKLSDARSLFCIETLGFRGEALPSIAAVADVVCRSAPTDDGVAHELHIRGGEAKPIEVVSGRKGTDMCVRALFYNTPARLKHLKTVHTELGHVTDFVYRLAMAHPHIAFRLTHEHNELLRTDGSGQRLHAFAAVYGVQTAQRMFALTHRCADFEIDGFISPPDVHRAHRQAMTLLINGRYVRMVGVHQAIVHGYGTMLPAQRYPLAVLSVRMHPELVDVNVHPAKIEVRCTKEAQLIAIVRNAIAQTLRAQTLIPLVPVDIAHLRARVAVLTPPKQQTPPPPKVPVRSMFSPPSVANQPPQPRDKQRFPTLEIIGAVHGTYIVGHDAEGMVLIDQHAAHERVHYERILQAFSEQHECVQPLLIPRLVELTPVQHALVAQRAELLVAIGVVVEPFGGHALLVRAHPPWMEDALHDIIESVLVQGRFDRMEWRDHTAKRLACRSSVRAHEPQTIEAMRDLVHQLSACTDPFMCPHGRPTMVRWSAHDLAKRFGRSS